MFEDPVAVIAWTGTGIFPQKRADSLILKVLDKRKVFSSQEKLKMQMDISQKIINNNGLTCSRRILELLVVPACGGRPLGFG